MLTLFPSLSGYWYGVLDGDPRAVAVYERHYSAPKKPRGNQNISAPGERIVLLGAQSDALFVWTRQQYRADKQRGVNCAVFRRESTCAEKASDLIREAMNVAWSRWPGERLFTFIDPAQVKPTMRRGSATYGYSYLKAGWRRCGETPKGLLIFEALPPVSPIDVLLFASYHLWQEAA